MYNVRRQLLELSTENKKVAEQNLQILEERYNSGLINSFDYRQIQNAFQNAAFNEYSLLFLNLFSIISCLLVKELVFLHSQI